LYNKKKTSVSVYILEDSCHTICSICLFVFLI